MGERGIRQPGKIGLTRADLPPVVPGGKNTHGLGFLIDPDNVRRQSQRENSDGNSNRHGKIKAPQALQIMTDEGWFFIFQEREDEKIAMQHKKRAYRKVSARNAVRIQMVNEDCRCAEKAQQIETVTVSFFCFGVCHTEMITKKKELEQQNVRIMYIV